MLRALILVAGWLFCLLAHGQVVDTWRFASEEQQAQALHIAAALRCPQCQNQNLLESNAPVAVSMRHQVYKMVEEGKDETQITAYMTARYGDFVRYDPPFKVQTWLLWLLPGLLLPVLMFALWRSTRLRPSGVTLPAFNVPEPRLPSALSGRKITAIFLASLGLCLAVYLMLPRFSLVHEEWQRQADPLKALTQEQQQENALVVLQNRIRATPADSALWAELGEYYLWRNAFDNALVAYRQALNLRGENAELYAAMATVLYYQAGQDITPDAQGMINKALAMDSNEVTALMLLASHAFMHAEYTKAATLWQQLLDAKSPRINRAQLLQSVAIARQLAGQ